MTDPFVKGQIYLVALTAEEKLAIFTALVLLYNTLSGNTPNFSSTFYQAHYTQGGKFMPMDISDLRNLTMKIHDYENVDDLYDDSNNK